MTHTTDTKREIQAGEGLYYNEFTGEWYDSKLRLLIDALKSGSTKEELAEACDIDNDYCYIFWTTYEE